MPTRNVNLTDHYNSYVSEQLEAGRYKNASEVMRAGLRLLERQDAEDMAKLEALRRDAELGLKDYENGNYTVIDSKEARDKMFADIAKKVDEKARQA